MTKKFEWTRTIASFAAAPAFAAGVIAHRRRPLRPRGEAAVGSGGRPANGNQAYWERRGGKNFEMTVWPSVQPVGIVNFSVWTSSTPAWRKACTAQSAARSAAGVPVTRPPMVSLR